MNFLRKRFIFSLKYLTSLLNIVSLHQSLKNQTNCYGNRKGFRITTYKKKDLACLYCPNATARCATAP